MLGRLVQRFLGLGNSVVSLIDAEVRALGTELSDTGYAIGRLAIWIAVLATFVFWSVAVLLYAAVAGLTLVMPAWGAALVVAALLLVVTYVIYRRVRARVTELEMPFEIVRRRVDDHLEFWHELGGEGVSESARGASHGDRGRGEPRPDLEENW